MFVRPIHHKGVRTIWIHCRQRNEQKACYLCISQLIINLCGELRLLSKHENCMKSKNGVRKRWMHVCLSIFFFRQGQGSRSKWIQITEPNRIDSFFFFSCRIALRRRLCALGGIMWESILLIKSAPFSLLLYIGDWTLKLRFLFEHCVLQNTTFKSLPGSLMSHTKCDNLFTRNIIQMAFRTNAPIHLRRLFNAAQLWTSHRFSATHFNASDWVSEKINNSWSDAQYFQTRAEVILLLSFDIYSAIFVIANRRGGRRYRTIPNNAWIHVKALSQHKSEMKISYEKINCASNSITTFRIGIAREHAPFWVIRFISSWFPWIRRWSLLNCRRVWTIEREHSPASNILHIEHRLGDTWIGECAVWMGQRNAMTAAAAKPNRFSIRIKHVMPKSGERNVKRLNRDFLIVWPGQCSVCDDGIDTPFISADSVQMVRMIFRFSILNHRALLACYFYASVVLMKWKTSRTMAPPSSFTSFNWCSASETQAVCVYL